MITANMSGSSDAVQAIWSEDMLGQLLYETISLSSRLEIAGYIDGHKIDSPAESQGLLCG